MKYEGSVVCGVGRAPGGMHGREECVKDKERARKQVVAQIRRCTWSECFCLYRKCLVCLFMQNPCCLNVQHACNFSSVFLGMHAIHLSAFSVCVHYWACVHVCACVCVRKCEIPCCRCVVQLTCFQHAIKETFQSLLCPMYCSWREQAVLVNLYAHFQNIPHLTHFINIDWDPSVWVHVWQTQRERESFFYS